MTLPQSRTPVGQLGWQALLESPATALLVLDFDGTLAPIVADPELARPHPDTDIPLRQLVKTLGTVAILTGRPAEMAARLLSADTDPALSGLVVLGQYGFEWWSAGAGLVTEVDVASRAAVAAVRQVLPELLASLGAPEGVTVEDKEIALAVHVRRTVDPARTLTLLRAPLVELAARYGLRLEPGRMVLELRPPGVDKGRALERLAVERGSSVVVYAGDDLGDLAAFDAVDRLRARGIPGVLICSGSSEVTELADRADVVVDGVGGIGALLAVMVTAVRSAVVR